MSNIFAQKSMLIFENRYYNDCYAVFQSDLRYQVVSAFLFKKFKYGKFSFLINNGGIYIGIVCIVFINHFQVELSWILGDQSTDRNEKANRL